MHTLQKEVTSLNLHATISCAVISYDNETVADVRVTFSHCVNHYNQLIFEKRFACDDAPSDAYRWLALQQPIVAPYFRPSNPTFFLPDTITLFGKLLEAFSNLMLEAIEAAPETVSVGT